MRKILFISPSGTGWKVHWQHQAEGESFYLKESALKHAKKLVGQLFAGQVASIRVQREDGTFQTEWSYGVDLFPPRG